MKQSAGMGYQDQRVYEKEGVMLKMQRHISCIVVSEESKIVNIWEVMSVCEIAKGQRQK